MIGWFGCKILTSHKLWISLENEITKIYTYCRLIYIDLSTYFNQSQYQWAHKVLFLMRKVGCSNPSRDRPKSIKQEVTLGNRCKCHGSSEMTIINEYPVSKYMQMWHAQ